MENNDDEQSMNSTSTDDSSEMSEEQSGESLSEESSSESNSGSEEESQSPKKHKNQKKSFKENNNNNNNSVSSKTESIYEVSEKSWLLKLRLDIKPPKQPYKTESITQVSEFIEAAQIKIYIPKSKEKINEGDRIFIYRYLSYKGSGGKPVKNNEDSQLGRYKSRGIIAYGEIIKIEDPLLLRHKKNLEDKIKFYTPLTLYPEKCLYVSFFPRLNKDKELFLLSDLELEDDLLIPISGHPKPIFNYTKFHTELEKLLRKKLNIPQVQNDESDLMLDRKKIYEIENALTVINSKDIDSRTKKLLENVLRQAAKLKYFHLSPQNAAKILAHTAGFYKLEQTELNQFENDKQYPRAIDSSIVIGFWGEETIFYFLKLKYEFIYNKTNKKNTAELTKDGFELFCSGWKVGDKKDKKTQQSKICPEKVQVIFPNLGAYESWMKSGNAKKNSKEHYDFHIVKTHPIFRKKRLDEVKTTTKNHPDDHAEFTEPEISAMKKNINSKKYRAYNIWCAGTQEVAYGACNGEDFMSALNLKDISTEDSVISGILVNFSKLFKWKEKQKASGIYGKQEMEDNMLVEEEFSIDINNNKCV